MINSFSLRLIPLRPLVNASGFYVWRQELSMIFESLEYFKENLRKHAKKRRNISFIYLVEEIRSFFKYSFFSSSFLVIIIIIILFWEAIMKVRTLGGTWTFYLCLVFSGFLECNIIDLFALLSGLDIEKRTDCLRWGTMPNALFLGKI